MLFRLTLAFAATLVVHAADVRPWNQDVLYFVLTDRFLDGDPENNIAPGSDASLHDSTQQDITKYHGGDLRGLEKALASGYFDALGVTALWISPPVRNVWNSPDSSGAATTTGYHGYWAQDFLDIDPHWTSRRSLDGTREYENSREGRMQHYKDFVILAHSHGIKVVQDIVCNHAGLVFYYDGNGNSQLDRDDPFEWLMPYKRDDFHDFTQWMNIPEWNALRTMPGGPVTILGRDVKTSGLLQKLETYSRKGMDASSQTKHNGEELQCDLFAARDINTDPTSAHFSQLVDEFVEIYSFYLTDIGVDGFGIESAKLVHSEFLEAFNERLRVKVGSERSKQLLLVGKINSGSALACGKFTFPLKWPAQKEPCFDSVLNFQMCAAARDYLRHSLGVWGSAGMIQQTLITQSGNALNPTPSTDGLTARQKLINFIECHEGASRFRITSVSARQNLLANTLLLTTEGIPCLYYGTEAALTDTRGNFRSDSDSGRLTFIPRGQEEKLRTQRDGETFRELAALIKVRSQIPALTDGEQNVLWVDSGETKTDDGTFAFARYTLRSGKPDNVAVVVFNAANSEFTTGSPKIAMRLIAKDGQPLIPKDARLTLRVTVPSALNATANVVWQKGIPTAGITLPGKSAAIFTIEKAK